MAALMLAMSMSSAGMVSSAAMTTGAEIDARDPRLSRDGPMLLVAGAPFSGVTVERDADGHVRARHEYRDGRADGIAREWYADGRLAAERSYASGLKVGVHRGWWPNGNPRFEYHFAGGEHEGIARTWYDNGQTSAEHRYVRGAESGRQRMWDSDGTLVANYEVRDGRRFGTIGAKPCVTAAHDGKGAA